MKANLLIAAILITQLTVAQQIIPLYKDSIPNATGYNMKEAIKVGADKEIEWIFKTSVPTITIYKPSGDKITGTAMIIFPGGGYSGVSYKAEGTDIAKECTRNGITAFIIKYRLPSDSIMKDKSIGPLQDAQQAIKFVREYSAEYKIKKIGIIGFSAGGHLASTLGTHFTKSYIANPFNTPLRPDFMILVYPVISMEDEWAHKGSRENLLGKDPTDSVKKYFSNDEQVTESTPPTFITHTQDDHVVDVENSICFYQALRHHQVPAEMHLYPKGDHGFVLHAPPAHWMGSVMDWIKSLNEQE